MALVFPRELIRDADVQSTDFTMGNVISMTQSIFTMEQQVQNHQGEWWEVRVNLVPMKEAKAKEWIAWMASLEGMRKTFLIGDIGAYTPRGTASSNPGTPVINGGSQTGNTLNIDGLPHFETGYLLPGDDISIGSSLNTRLLKVLEQVDTDSGGNASINVWPAITTAPSDGSTVKVASAKGAFRLDRNRSSWGLSSAKTYDIRFTAVSVI